MVEASASFSDIRFRIRSGIPLRLDGAGMTNDEFYAFCQENPELRIERNPQGQISIMPPTTTETGRQNAEILSEIVIWNRATRLGHTFDSSTGFKLPNGANRSPDVAWISKEHWAGIPLSERQSFAPIVPDFLVELRSNDQSLMDLREKMDEYMDNGCQLAWLIDPQNRRTYVYSGNGDIQTVKFEDVLSGGLVLPGLEMRLDTLLA